VRERAAAERGAASFTGPRIRRARSSSVDGIGGAAGPQRTGRIRARLPRRGIGASGIVQQVAPRTTNRGRGGVNAVGKTYILARPGSREALGGSCK